MWFASKNWKHGCTASYQIEIHGQLASWIYHLYDNNHCWATMVSFIRVGDLVGAVAYLVFSVSLRDTKNKKLMQTIDDAIEFYDGKNDSEKFG